MSLVSKEGKKEILTEMGGQCGMKNSEAEVAASKSQRSQPSLPSRLKIHARTFCPVPFV